MSETSVTTGMVRFSYLNVWEPKQVNGEGDPKYSVSLIIPKSDTITKKKIDKIIKELVEAVKVKNNGKLPARFKLPLRDGDEERPDDEVYKDAWFLNANSKNKPGVVDKNVAPILDQSEVYSGAYGRASVNFYSFDVSGNKGIACGLSHIQKLKDGESLGGKMSIAEAFADDFEDDDDLM